MTHKESETVEFKKSTSELREAVVSISAILNKHGRGEGIFELGRFEGNEYPILGYNQRETYAFI